MSRDEGMSLLERAQALPPYVDNTPLQYMRARLEQVLRKVSFKGCEVLEVKFNEIKAVIRVKTVTGLRVDREERGYAVHDYSSDIRIVWRLPPSEADRRRQALNDSRVRLGI